MTRNAMLSRVMLKLGLPLSTFSEPEIQNVILPHMIEAENRILRDTRADQEEMLVTLEVNQTHVKLPSHVATIDKLEINGTDYTDSRVPPQDITLL